MALLGLTMIVKNEAKSIRGVLEAVKMHVDRWTILDTGSIDGTQDIVRETMDGLPGELFEEPFAGFAASRNRVLELAGDTTQFSLMLSGDEYLRDGEKLREYLTTQLDTNVDCFFVRLLLDDVICPQPRIFRTGGPWQFDDFGLGIHEVPVCPGPPGYRAPVAVVDGGYIEHIVSDPIARMDNIWENHIPQLEAVLEKDPNNARAIEFLTQSYESFIGFSDEDERKELATKCILLYHRRFALPFQSEEERNVYVMRYLDDCRFTDVYSPEELFALVDALCKKEPKRPEIALMRAVVASTCTTMLASEVYRLSVEACRVGEAARKDGGLNNSSPLTTSTEWKAHRLAAVAAKQLSSKHAEYMPLAREHIAAGLALGGPWALFKPIMDDAAALSTAVPAGDSPIEASVL